MGAGWNNAANKEVLNMLVFSETRRDRTIVSLREQTRPGVIPRNSKRPLLTHDTPLLPDKAIDLTP